jgi:hypothetical protein
MSPPTAPDSDAETPTKPEPRPSLVTDLRSSAATLLGVLAFTFLAVDPALAQSGVSAFCQTDMASTIKNLFTLIQFGGPLIGGVIALGATVATPTVRRADMKKELKEMRNQAIIWGLLVAPLATTIIQFLLNNIVAGGASCGF